MAAVVPKGFDIVPDERLPNVPEMAQAPDPLDGIPEGGEAAVGTWSDGRPKIRKNLGGGQYIEGAYDDAGNWSAVSEIGGSLADGVDVPEGFDPLPTDLPYGEGEQGTVAQDDTPLLDDEKVTDNAPQISAGGAAWRGLQSNALLGFDDELQGAAGAVGNKVGQILGLNDTEIPMSEVYKQIRDKARDEKDAAFDQHMLAYGAGALPGLIISAPVIGGRVAQGETALRTAGNLAAAGARQGAVSGAGNSEDELGVGTIGDMAEGAAIGGIAAPVAAPVVNGLARVGSGVRNALFPNNTLNSGLEVLSRSAPQDATAMRAASDEMVRAGVSPRLMDVVDESGRGAIRSAGSRMTPAREELARHADQVYASAQGRVSRQARNAISTAPGTARGLGRTIADEQANLGPVFDSVRDQPVAITPEMIQAFSTAEGRSALRAISKWMEPEDAAALNEFTRAVQRSGGGDPDAAIRSQFPGDWDALPEAVKASIRTQMGIPADPFAGSPLTVDIVDKFARVLNHRAKDIPALQRVAQQYSDIVRAPARQQYPDYDEALNTFAANARVGEAASGTGRFEGTDFLSTPSDEYAANIATARTQPQSVPGPQGQPTVSEADAIRMRARDDIVDRATGGSGAQAMSVARQISRGDDQALRNRALLGDNGAEALERGMAAEVRRVDNTRYVDPRTGSQTAGREQDLGEVAGDAVLNGASGGKWAAVRAATQFIRQAGIRGVDSERLVRDAMDPQRTAAAIDFLEQRGLDRERARSLMRSIAATVGGRAGGAASYDKPEGPRSQTSILNRSRQVNQGGGAGNGADTFQP